MMLVVMIMMVMTFFDDVGGDDCDDNDDSVSLGDVDGIYLLQGVVNMMISLFIPVKNKFIFSEKQFTTEVGRCVCMYVCMYAMSAT